MKKNGWTIVSVAIPLLLLAAEEAPPAELLENLEFFQNYELVNDREFISQSTTTDKAVDPSTAPVKERGDDDATQR